MACRIAGSARGPFEHRPQFGPAKKLAETDAAIGARPTQKNKASAEVCYPLNGLRFSHDMRAGFYDSLKL
jgi:hypothetical protein